MHKVYVNISYAYHRVVLRVVYLFDLNFYQNTTHIFPGITSRNNLISNFFNKYVHKTPSFSSKTSSRKGNKKKKQEMGREDSHSKCQTIYGSNNFPTLRFHHSSRSNWKAENEYPSRANNGWLSFRWKERKKKERENRGGVNFILCFFPATTGFIIPLIARPMALQSYPAHMTVDSQKQIEMQRLQTEHLKRQQEHIMQHNIQELQAQMTKNQLSMSGPQSLMFLPFLEQLRGLPVQSPMPPPPVTSTSTTTNKHINSIANVRKPNQRKSQFPRSFPRSTLINAYKRCSQPSTRRERWNF